MQSPKSRLTDAVFDAMQREGWRCEITVGECENDVLIRMRTAGHEYERHMGWTRAYLEDATDAQLQADIDAVIRNIAEKLKA